MKTMLWITEGTWRGCIDAARPFVPADAEVVLLHVSSVDIPEAGHRAFGGLLGRGHRERDPGARLESLAAASADELLRAASDHLARPATSLRRQGRVEHEVVAAADDADLLVLARDGDRSRLGPRSIGHATRFVVDHAPCPVLLVWPAEPAS
jgi:nucleotide-binding universal stress UspA family protein